MDWGQILTNTVSAGLGVEAVVFALAAIGLNIHFGYTGLLNFGQAGFLAVAAYGLATMVATFSSSFWLGIVVIGLLVPLALEAVTIVRSAKISSGRQSIIAVLSSLCLLIGGLVMRFAILAAGANVAGTL